MLARKGNETSNILVIIVTYNAIIWIERCINSVVQSSLPADLYVIDNGSTDGTPKYIQNHFPYVFLVQSENNLGFGQANNKGLQYALDKGYDYVYLLNQDAWIYPDTLEILVKIQQQHSDYGVLSPIQIQANGQHFDLNFLKGTCSFNSTPTFLEDLFFKRKENVYEVAQVMAAHWLISRNCLSKVGGFSPTFQHYGEDSNYGHRLKYWGFKMGIVPLALAVHDRESRKVDLGKIMYFQYTDFLIRFSTPIAPERHLWLKYILDVVKYIVAKHSLIPLIYAIKVLRDYKKILHNRQITKATNCAFLKNGNNEFHSSRNTIVE